MSKRKERITINGETFTIENSTVLYGTRNNFKSLDMCYERPSKAKECIYDYWYEWFKNMGSYNFEHGITGYNCMQFTYGGYVWINDKFYYAHITKCYNRLYPVVTKSVEG